MQFVNVHGGETLKKPTWIQSDRSVSQVPGFHISPRQKYNFRILSDLQSLTTVTLIGVHAEGGCSLVAYLKLIIQTSKQDDPRHQSKSLKPDT